MSIARATDRAEGSGQAVNAKPSRTMPASRPSAWPGSDNSPSNTSRPNSTGLTSRIRPVAANSTAAAVVAHLMKFHLKATCPTIAECRPAGRESGHSGAPLSAPSLAIAPTRSRFASCHLLDWRNFVRAIIGRPLREIVAEREVELPERRRQPIRLLVLAR